MSPAELTTDERAPAPVSQAPPPPADDLPETVIEPRPGWRLVDVRELWRYRELLYFLTWRDVKVRYKQTALGVAWAVIQPVATMLVFSVVFARVGGVGDQLGSAYPIFVLAGLLPWTFFSSVLTSAASSVVGNQNLVSKVYFPRLIIPLSAGGVGVVDLAVSLAVLAVMLPFFGAAPGWSVVLLPVVVLLLAVGALGVGILLAALTVAYRDFRYVVPFLVQLWMFSTASVFLPVAGTVAADGRPVGQSVVGPVGELVMPLNPAYGLVLNFRNCAFGGPIDWYSLGASGAVAVVLLVAGCLYFRRVERSFADII